MEVPPSWGAIFGSEIATVSITGVERSEDHRVTLKCFSLEENHVTFSYGLLARTCHMALSDHTECGKLEEKVDIWWVLQTPLPQ